MTSAHTVFLFQIVDLSLLVKQEMTAKTNPISHLISASYIQYNTHAEVRIFTSITLSTNTVESHVVVDKSILPGFLQQVKKDPDSPEATPPSTPGSSHSSKTLPQGNGSLDGRARQRKRKKVLRWPRSYLHGTSTRCLCKTEVWCVSGLRGHGGTAKWSHPALSHQRGH